MSKIEYESEVDKPFTAEEVADRFPRVNPGIKPFGSRVVLQIRSPKKKSSRGVLLPDDIAETELFLTQTGMVRAIGPVAFKNRDTLQPWPEGDWVKEGSFVRMAKFNHDKWWVEYTDKDGTTNKALFMMCNDLDLLGGRTGNPFAISGYIK